MTPNPFLKDVEAAMDRFSEELADLIRVAAKQQILRHLGMGDDLPRLTMPKRRPVYLGPSRTKGRAPALKTKPDDLSPQLRNAYDRIHKAKRPVTFEALKTSMGVTEANARYILGQLMKTKIVTARLLGDGSTKKVYQSTKK